MDNYGLPPKKSYETQPSYIKRILMNRHQINTHIARAIEVHNLHSVLSTLKQRGVELTIIHKKVICPKSKKLKPHAVDVAFMTDEQIKKNEGEPE